MPKVALEAPVISYCLWLGLPRMAEVFPSRHTRHSQRHHALLQDIKMPGDQVDVNVHPTKHEVIMLHQEEVIQTLSNALEQLHSGHTQWASLSDLSRACSMHKQACVSPSHYNMTFV